MGELCDLLFELSSEERIGILRMIKGRRNKITSLARDLQITNQECSRHISRLASVGLVVKDPDGVLKLTPYAAQILIQLKSLEFSTRHRKYFLEHTVERIPLTFQMRLGELSNSQLIDDLMIVFKNIEKMYVEATDYVLRVTDRFILTTIPYVEGAFERGVRQRLLDPEDIIVPPDYSNTLRLDEALRSGQFINHSVRSCDFFLAMSEKGVASLSFPRLDGRFDYTGLMSIDPEFHKWCSDLFEHYWAESKSKGRDWLPRKVAESREQFSQGKKDGA